MTSINGISNVGYRPVVAFTSSEPYKSDIHAATAMPQQKEEKKSKHTVLKVLTVAAVVAGAVLLFKNRGKVVEKINTLIDRLKPAKPVVKPASPEGLDEIAEVVETTPKPPIVEQIEGMVGLDKPVKSAKESMGVFVKDDVKKALSQKTSVTAETIDAGFAARESGKSAKESMGVFVKDDVKKALSQKTSVTAETIDAGLAARESGKSAKESMGVFVKDDVKKALSQKTSVTAETIDAGLAANESGKLAQDSASVFEKFGLTEYEKSLASAQKNTKPIVSGNTNGSVTVAKPQGTSSQTTAPVVLPDKVVAPKAPKAGRKKYYEPSKNKVVREHSVLAQGEKVKPRSKTNSRKIRHNKRQIIDQTLAQEQAEFAPMFKGKKKTKIQHPVRQQAQPEQVVNRISTPQVKTTQYTYPESVYKFEQEMAAKKKAADIKAAWDEYDYRRLYG